MGGYCLMGTVSAPAGVAQWIDCRPENQRVTGSIPSQGTCQKKKKRVHFQFGKMKKF